jgi:hypothetical protein
LANGGTITTEWGISQESTTASNYFAGVTTFASTVTTGALTTNGGLQTFGANDSGGAGYRLVRVPNL